MRPRGIQEASQKLPQASKGFQEASRHLQDGQDRFQDGSKAAQQASKCFPGAQNLLSARQDVPQRPPDASQTLNIASKTVQNVRKLSKAYFPASPMPSPCQVPNHAREFCPQWPSTMADFHIPWLLTKGGLAVVRPRRASSSCQTTLVNHGRVKIKNKFFHLRRSFQKKD